MRNLKFGVFCLGLIAAIATAVSSLGAQPRVPFDFAQDRQVEPRGDRTVTILDGRGSQLGVMVSDLDPKAAGTTGGVKIDEVNEDSPAEKAGLKAGDVVVGFDGERVRSARQFTRLVQETPEGRSVKIDVLRDGKKQTLDATPESRTAMTWRGFGVDPERLRDDIERGMRGFRFDTPRDFDFRFDDRGPRRFEYRLPAPGSRLPGSSRGRLGVSVQSLTPELEEYFGAKNGGALVSSVAQDSAAAKAGIKAGDVITSINGRGVDDPNDLMRELGDTTGEVTIVVLRDKKEMTLKATIDRPSGRQVVRPSVRG